MAQGQVASGRCTPAWPKDALRITFGVIWLVDAALKWLPGFRASYMPTIMAEAQGQPGWPQPWFHFWIRFQHPDALPLAYLVAVLETLIAVALIAGFARKITYSAAIVFSLLIWATAEGFGGPYTSGASDIGTAIIYAVVFAALLALSYYAGPSRYSADYYLEQKISWWWRIAETRRPVPAEAPAADLPAATAEEPAVAEPHRHRRRRPVLLDADDDQPARVHRLSAVVPRHPTAAGMHAGTLTFTASTPGTYHYLCPVPGHAQKGMTGLFTVTTG